MTVTIDLNTRMIGDQSKVWIIHPGKRKIYFEAFKNNNVAFLDMPGLQVRRGDFNDPNALQNVIESLRNVSAIKSVYRSNTDFVATRQDVAAAADNLQELDASSDLGIIRSLYHEARKGDLIIGTTIGHYAPLLVGEIATSFSPRDTISIDRYTGYPIPVRRVNWFDTNVAKRDFSQAISKRMENRHAIIELNKSRYGEEVYTRTYLNFASSLIGKAELLGPRYSSSDPLETYPAAKLIKVLISIYIGLESGQLELATESDFDAVIQQFYDEQLVKDFTQNFNSPGEFILKSLSPLLPIFVAAGVALCVHAADDQTQQGDEIVVTNSKLHDDLENMQQIEQTLNQFWNSLSPQGRDSLKDLAREADEKIGLSVETSVTND